MKRRILAALAAVLTLAAGDALAQAWPTRPIKLVAPYPPGGQTDVVSRYFAEKLSGLLGQQLIVDNKAPTACWAWRWSRTRRPTATRSSTSTRR